MLKTTKIIKEAINMWRGKKCFLRGLVSRPWILIEPFISSGMSPGVLGSRDKSILPTLVSYNISLHILKASLIKWNVYWRKKNIFQINFISVNFRLFIRYFGQFKLFFFYPANYISPIKTTFTSLGIVFKSMRL